MSRDYRAELRAVRDRYWGEGYARRSVLVFTVATAMVRGLTSLDARPCEDRMADIVRILDAVDEIEKEDR